MKNFMFIVFFCCFGSASYGFAESKEASQWNFEVHADQQESFGYDASVGYRLPVFDSAVMPLFKLPGLYFQVGAGERSFSSTNPSDSALTARSWHWGWKLKAPINDAAYFSTTARSVRLTLPEEASKHSLSYLEVGWAYGLGAAKGANIEIGNSVRYISRLDRPVQIGKETIEKGLTLYPTLSIGYQL